MQAVTGKSVQRGIAVGPLCVLRDGARSCAAPSYSTQAEEWMRFEIACGQAKEELSALYEKASSQVGEETAAIFEIHRMMLEDEDYLQAVRDALADGRSAEQAVTAAGEHFSKLFADMDDPCMQARSVDVTDISGRVSDILSGCGWDELPGEGAVILAADDLTPGRIMQLGKDRLLGFVTRRGSTNSHTAILARAMNIPALIGVEVDGAWDGKPGALDGNNGCLYVEPDGDLLSRLEDEKSEEQVRRAWLAQLKGKPNVTADGRSVEVYANIGGMDDVELALQNDAGGIGLLRSEFLYLGLAQPPREESQFAVYRQVAEAMRGKRVIFRTLDLGADKTVPWLNTREEENRALGCRGIRICLSHREIFKPQLRAILRAGVYGAVSVMFPMVISVQELREAKSVLEECRRELEAEGIPVGEVEVGVMIETPAAVVMADELAEEADFFSIGTNDLTQYTLAMDRRNSGLESFFDPYHPAILRMIRHTVEAAHRHNCRVGICGELAADPALTETFLNMRVDELSVSPGMILALRSYIRGLGANR